MLSHAAMPCVVCCAAPAGVRLVVEVKRGFSPELVLNQLYKNTRLQLRFASNMVRPPPIWNAVYASCVFSV
jgi:hypothetical protein